MNTTIYISRDSRTGSFLNVPNDGYKYEYPDIEVSVNVSYAQGEWELESAQVIDNNGFELMPVGTPIELSTEEFSEAVEQVSAAERGLTVFDVF